MESRGHWNNRVRLSPFGLFIYVQSGNVMLKSDNSDARGCVAKLVDFGLSVHLVGLCFLLLYLGVLPACCLRRMNIYTIVPWHAMMVSMFIIEGNRGQQGTQDPHDPRHDISHGERSVFRLIFRPEVHLLTPSPLNPSLSPSLSMH